MQKDHLKRHMKQHEEEYRKFENQSINSSMTSLASIRTYFYTGHKSVSEVSTRRSDQF